MARPVLIIDDHPSFRASARRVLEDGGFVVIGEAQDDASGLAAAAAMRPSVVLTSSRDVSELGEMVARSGARGFVPEDEMSRPALEALLR
jgi:DNA-binding NarL/FixJ family response regulator